MPTMTHELTLTPAYGRDYKTADEVKKAWEDGKDFKIATVMSPYCGAYTSIKDMSTFPGLHFKIRYNKKTDFVLVEIATGKFCNESEDEE